MKTFLVVSMCVAFGVLVWVLRQVDDAISGDDDPIDDRWMR